MKSQTHAEASKHIDQRGYVTFVFFGLAGVFLGVYLYHHFYFVKAALQLPLRMLIVKKVCDFLGRTMFTLIVLADLILYVFNKLYGGELGDRLEGQGFEVPLTQMKRLFVDRDDLIEKIENEEE